MTRSIFHSMVRWSLPRSIQFLPLLYILGESSQYLLIGPNWLRWHLSDFAFPFVICYFFSSITIGRFHPRIGMIIGGVLGVIAESIFTILSDGRVGFDVIDIACFFVATILGIFLSKSSIKRNL